MPHLEIASRYVTRDDYNSTMGFCGWWVSFFRTNDGGISLRRLFRGRGSCRPKRTSEMRGLAQVPSVREAEKTTRFLSAAEKNEEGIFACRRCLTGPVRRAERRTVRR